MKCSVDKYNRTLIGCLWSYGLFGLFLLLAIVLELFHLNQRLFCLINGFHGMLPDQIWLAINYICDAKHFILSVILLIATLLFSRKNTIRVLILIILYYLVFSGLKKFFHEARPFVVLPAGSFYWLNSAEKLLGREYMSFPSGHVGMAAIFVFVSMRLFFSNSIGFKILLFLFLLLVCFARICTGWHWPLDVIASGLIGYVLVRLCLTKCC